MSEFKTKTTKKRGKGGGHKTLDAIHQKKIEKFQEMKNSLPQKNKLLKDNQKKLEFLRQKKNNQLSDEELYTKIQLDDDIRSLQQEINNIESNQEEIDYLLQNGPLVFQYYENMNAIAEGNNCPTRAHTTTKKIWNDSILDFFQAGENITDKEEHESEEDEYQSREKLLDQYLGKVDPHHVRSMEHNPHYEYCTWHHEDSSCQGSLLWPASPQYFSRSCTFYGS